MTSKASQVKEILEAIDQNGLMKIGHISRPRIDFKNLMQFRINNILFVCSFYDYYTIVEDGHLQEVVFNEFHELNIHYAPRITHAYSSQKAMEYLEDKEYDLIITTFHIGDKETPEFAAEVKKKYPDIPLVLLSSQSRELQKLIDREKLNSFDRIFIWTGDRKIFLAIVKIFEDIRNAHLDCKSYGVTSIILVEDSPLFFSAYLPLIYTEVVEQTQRLIVEGANTAEKLLRQRARPKILHAESYEEAMELYNEYKDTLLGIITDLKFEHEGKDDRDAGLKLMKKVKEVDPMLPILIQTSSQETSSVLSHSYDVSVLDKNSRTLLLELREFMKNNFGFGDFIFKMPNGGVLDRAANLSELWAKISYIHEDSLIYHASNNHFSHWLKARTEFELANEIKPIKVNQFETSFELRKFLIGSIQKHLNLGSRGSIGVFSRGNYDSGRVIQFIGEGSLGGKARGLAFIDKVLKDYLDPDYFPGVKINVPHTVVLGTEVFNRFLEKNELYSKVIENIPDDRILRYFLKAELPATVIGDIGEILNKAKFPMAVRSSSLLEDAVYQPFAGVYSTVMIPNSNAEFSTRFHNLVQAIKFVYASTYYRNAKNYIEATGNRIEEEKMALIIQRVVGRKYGSNFYPHFSGVARSYNYYPFGKAQPGDGVVNLAIGLGKTIVDGGISLQYSPAYPTVYPQFGNRKDLFSKSQVKFYSINLNSDVYVRTPSEERHLVKLHIEDSEKDGTLEKLASTYSAENDMLYEGIFREGPRIVDFGPILKSGVFPLNDIIKLLLKISETAMNCPVEMEFAVVLGEEGEDSEFRVLQVRPMVKQEGSVKIDYEKIKDEDIIFKSAKAMGNGQYESKYVLYVKPDSFDKSKTRQIADEINSINLKLLKENKSYVLIGPGRWGSSDPWLGIPVEFSYISAAQVVAEIVLPDMIVDPSQGSHFFHNITSFKIAYLTLGMNESQEIDWEWLENCQVLHETEFIKLVSVENDLYIKIDGKTGRGVALKGG